MRGERLRLLLGLLVLAVGLRFAYELVVQPDDLYSIRCVRGRMMRRLAPRLADRRRSLRAGPAAAERLVVSLSNHRVLITSNFAGEDLVLFGTVEPDAGKTLRSGGYDLVVTVTGPRQTLRTRRKERVLGIWVNVDAREFVGVPSYLAMLSNRPVATIANVDTLRRLQIGLDNFLLPQRIGPDLADTVRDDPFRKAFVRLQARASSLSRAAERGDVPDAGGVPRRDLRCRRTSPIGNYEVDVKLFADGALVARASSALEVIKVGFEQYVADAARDNGLLYGLGDRADGAVHRLGRQRGVPQRLVRQAALGGKGVEAAVAQHVRGKGRACRTRRRRPRSRTLSPPVIGAESRHHHALAVAGKAAAADRAAAMRRPARPDADGRRSRRRAASARWRKVSAPIARAACEDAADAIGGLRIVIAGDPDPVAAALQARELMRDRRRQAAPGRRHRGNCRPAPRRSAAHSARSSAPSRASVAAVS